MSKTPVLFLLILCGTFFWSVTTAVEAFPFEDDGGMPGDDLLEALSTDENEKNDEDEDTADDSEDDDDDDDEDEDDDDDEDEDEDEDEDDEKKKDDNAMGFVGDSFDDNKSSKSKSSSSSSSSSKKSGRKQSGRRGNRNKKSATRVNIKKVKKIAAREEKNAVKKIEQRASSLKKQIKREEKKDAQLKKQIEQRKKEEKKTAKKANKAVAAITKASKAKCAKAAKKAIKRLTPVVAKAAAPTPAAAAKSGWTYETWRKSLLKKMWRVVKGSRSSRNRRRYQRLRKVYNRRRKDWRKARKNIRKLLTQRQNREKYLKVDRRRRRQEIRKVARAYRRRRSDMRSRYEQSYRRYLKLIARYFRQKYRVLVVEYLREHRQNAGLKRALWNLRDSLHHSLKAKQLFKDLNKKKQELDMWKRKAAALETLLSALRRHVEQLKRTHGGELDKAKKAHAQTTAHLNNANSRIQALQKQVNDLQGKLSLSDTALKQCRQTLNAEVNKARAAAAAASKKYDDLEKKYKAAIAHHGNVQRQLANNNDAMKREIAKLKDRCIPDICGKCNGDESSCAKRTTPSTCHSVGDPHYRSYDGYTFDYHVDGEFVFSKHLEDFEVQNLQRPCPNPMPRCNKAVAVRGGKHIVVVYASWGTGTILVDGNRVRTNVNQRIQVSNDFSYTARPGNIEIRFKDSLVRALIHPWSNTHYMDIYVTAPGRWSSGRSMSGLCGNFNNNWQDDRANIGNARQFWVAGTGHSLFQNPKPRTQAQLAEEDLEMKQAAKTAATRVTPDTTDTQRPTHNLKIAWKNEAQRQTVRKLCHGALHGWDRLNCEFDALAGVPTEENKKNFQLANVLDHEKMLFVCKRVEAAPSVVVAANRLPSPQRNEGFSVAFWFQPDAVVAADSNLIAKGDQFAVNVEGSDLIVRHGQTECKSTAAIEQDKWIQVVITVKKSGSVTTFIDGEETCSEKVDDTDLGVNSALVVVDKTTTLPAAKGYMARLFYVPITVRKQDVKRYSERRVPKCDAESVDDEDETDGGDDTKAE